MAEEAPVRMIDDGAAFKAMAKSAPNYTIRPKLPSTNDVKNRLPTEPASRGDLRAELEATKLPRQPSWIMGTREAGLMPPPKQPGPGEYKLESTLFQKHPTEVMTGRGWSWGTTGRTKIGASKEGPGPLNYRPSSEPALKKFPEYSIGVKRKDPADKEKRPGCQTYKVDGLLRDGPNFTPAWSLGDRREANPKPPTKKNSEPGPGAYHPHIESNGRRDRAPKWGFYQCDRFKPLKQNREPPY